MNPGMEALAIAGAFAACSVWMMRYSMTQQRNIAERFIRHLEALVEEGKRDAERHRAAIRALAGAVHRNSALLTKLLEERNGAERKQRHDQTKVQNCRK
ncbi:MAG: hypothetical protein KIT74_02665 [Fimbriimonadales bacterium]|nr:hypothetical protein [Fimbriimonadales bacterium]